MRADPGLCVTAAHYPIPRVDYWNLILAFALMIRGFMMTTGWRRPSDVDQPTGSVCSRHLDMVSCGSHRFGPGAQDLGGSRPLRLRQAEVLGYAAHLVAEVGLVVVDHVVEVTEQLEADTAHQLCPRRQRAC